jgi:glycosyltransferase involved in cell wall biosynthesis
MKISVIIGTYNQAETLKLVLGSFGRQTLPAAEFEVVVVDSSSTDGTEAAVKSLNLPYHLNYLRVENKGKSFARNQGVKQAKADLLFLTDADMVADPDLLNRHVLGQKDNAAIEGVTFNLKKHLKIDELSPTNPQVAPYIQQIMKPGQKLQWSYFLSGNLSLPRKLFDQAGGFDENFSVYGWEDIELGYRLHKMNIPLIYDPQAINYHFHFVSNQDMVTRKYNMGRSAAYFYKKHPNFEIKMYLGMNPLAMGIFNLLKTFPQLRTRIKNQYIIEEFNYRLGLMDGLKSGTARS